MFLRTEFEVGKKNSSCLAASVALDEPKNMSPGEKERQKFQPQIKSNLTPTIHNIFFYFEKISNNIYRKFLEKKEPVHLILY